MNDLLDLPGTGLLALYAKHKISPVEVLDATLGWLRRDEPRINAFTIVDEEGARVSARASEARWQRGEPNGLADGLVASVKDNLLLAGFPARRGLVASDSAPALDVAPCVARLNDLLLTLQVPVPAIEAEPDIHSDGSYAEDWINWSPFTYPFNLTPQPAARAPCGVTAAGLPVGLRSVGPMRGDALVLCAARALERARPFARIDKPRD